MQKTTMLSRINVSTVSCVKYYWKFVLLTAGNSTMELTHAICVPILHPFHTSNHILDAIALKVYRFNINLMKNIKLLKLWVFYRIKVTYNEGLQ